MLQLTPFDLYFASRVRELAQSPKAQNPEKISDSELNCLALLGAMASAASRAGHNGLFLYSTQKIIWSFSEQISDAQGIIFTIQSAKYPTEWTNIFPEFHFENKLESLTEESISSLLNFCLKVTQNLLKEIFQSQSKLLEILKTHPLFTFHKLSEDSYIFSLRRYAQAEISIEKKLTKLSERHIENSQLPNPQLFSQFFPSHVVKRDGTELFNELNTQHLAAFCALRNSFSLITGGPGTGKTTTVSRILGLLLYQNPTLKIAICAPTGKAVNRLNESLRSGKQQLFELAEKKNILLSLHHFPTQAKTIHRLLGNRPYDFYQPFNYNSKSLLPYDIVIIDEVSMVGLKLMSALLEAISDSTKLIWLGDKDQLDAVENGRVLADLIEKTCPNSPKSLNFFTPNFCQSYETYNFSNQQIEVAKNATPLKDCIVELQYTYRSESAPKLAEWAKEINSRQMPRGIPRMTLAGWIEKFAHQFCPPQNCQISDPNAKENLAIVKFLLTQNRILCATNQQVELANAMVRRVVFPEQIEEIFSGNQIIILANDYELGVYNGDIAIILPDKNGNLLAWFPIQDAEGNEFLRGISPIILPKWAPAFALTIHKSQGSEYTNILLSLPNSFSPILSKELLYTGLTRASKECYINDPKNLFALGLKNTAVFWSSTSKIPSH